MSKHSPPPKTNSGPARTTAADVLIAVLGRNIPLESAFERVFKSARLSPRDRAFAYNLVLTSLRHLGEIEAAVASCLERPLARQAIRARAALVLGACQLLFLRTPAHAAVATSVALAEMGGAARLKGLINAVLRRIAREPGSFLAGQDPARANTPAWLWARWKATFGEDTCRRIAESHLAEPPLDLTVRADPEAWARRLGGRVLPTGTVRLADKGPITGLDGYAEGAWWVQDAAAALPARLLGDVKGLVVFDLCAAPGGKTAQLASLGANVVALDRSPARIARLRENLARLKLEGECIAADALSWTPKKNADVVVLDAPCSGSGTIRRHPDILHARKAEDIAELGEIQARLLAAAARLVRPGGRLLYAVCSLEPEEGPARIEGFLATGAPFRRVPAQPGCVAGCAEFLTPAGELRTLPCQWSELGGLDGFYAAVLRRNDG